MALDILQHVFIMRVVFLNLRHLISPKSNSFILFSITSPLSFWDHNRDSEWIGIYVNWLLGDEKRY